MITKSELMNNLENNNLVIDFIKADGSTRTIYATLDMDLVPEDKLPKSYRETDDDLIIVFDLEQEDWRSFHISSIQDIRKPD